MNIQPLFSTLSLSLCLMTTLIHMHTLHGSQSTDYNSMTLIYAALISSFYPTRGRTRSPNAPRVTDLFHGSFLSSFNSVRSNARDLSNVLSFNDRLIQ